jgi:hypothetical protein
MIWRSTVLLPLIRWSHSRRTAAGDRVPRAAGLCPPAAALIEEPMRPVLSLLVGFAISVVGLIVVLATTLDMVGVLLIAAGVIVAVLGVRMAPESRSR